MKKYCITIMLALVLLFTGTNTTFADELSPFTQTKEEKNISLANWEKSLIGEDIFQNGLADPDLEKNFTN
ncbi:hypothetical protein PWEIH_10378 [Listeria weihenstephanensis FSL R9-0317]|uniref:hypothetical protein n=1 Tax=Listeria weihenstephanensis TaxID=1006155 RepID=UPI0003E86779|nr:hypothetical protein [Listeria weihenstephanensis]EUJ37376.1 hypothetical protein PWEIH_10378 [Listeria weihenstephanensis FSL R9-0317]